MKSNQYAVHTMELEDLDNVGKEKYVHVIEYSAYAKAIAALKRVRADLEHCAGVALPEFEQDVAQILRELGET